MPYKPVLYILLVVLIPAVSMAVDTVEENWLDDDVEFRIAEVNEGDLVFLEKPPAEPVHHHHNRIILDSSSLDNGWVTMIQCHSNLDVVPRTQVLYNEHRTDDLSILSYTSIGEAWVEGHTVQLTDIGQEASLCIRVRTRALEFNEDGSFSLRSGPFMRRFLDGYYPMRVSMDIEVPRDYLRFVNTQPTQQDGFEVHETALGLHVNTWFEGKLYTEVRFVADFCDGIETVTC